jgi:non-specific serine/threonine protein kinase
MEQRLGANHRFTLALRSTRFESFAAWGRYDEAANEALAVWQGASALAGPASHQALVGQIDYGSTLCQTVRRAEGLAIARQALGTVRQAFGADYPLTHAIRYYTAECLIANRRHAEAGELLAELDRQKVAELIGQADFGGLVDLALGEIALARGDKMAARGFLRAAAGELQETEDTGAKRRLARLREEAGA